MPSIGDLLFEMTEWLRTTPLVELSLWISESRLCLWMQEHFFAIPVMQTLHILAIAVAFGSVLMINLRILGLSGIGRTMAQTVRRYLPWMWWALAVLIVSGIGMIIGEPVRELINPIFWIKMVLVLALILASLGWQAYARRRLAHWEATLDGRISVRVGSAAILFLWFAVMAGGRWIAYAPV